MMKRWVILLLALQSVAILALAGWLFRSWRPPLLVARPPLHLAAALLLSIVAVFGLRLLISLNNFHLSARFGSATPDEHLLSAGGAVRLVLREFFSSMRVSSLDMLQPVGLQLAQPQQGLPVLLVHGYLCNSGYWRPMSALLRRAGISHLALDMEPLGASIDELAAQVQAGVERLCAATGSVQVVIVGHSMGGLVARAYVRRYGSAQVARIITLGSPHEGSMLARFAPGRNGAQMRYGSAWLRDLAAAEANLQRELFISMYSVHDNMVAPQNSSHFPPARNMVFGGIGHVALGRHPRVMEALLAEVRQAGLNLDKALSA
jgi:pimeloyl-ACP methyl ester carboxylesterase